MDLSTDYQPPSYNAFKDKYLESYFQSPTVQSHLRTVGMLTKDGRVMTDEEFKRAAVRRHQRWAARRQLAQRAVVQTRDFQLGRQLELRKQLDAVQKVETYRRLKGNYGHELIRIEPLDLERSMNRSQSAPGLRTLTRRSSAPTTSAASPEQQYLQSSGYQTDDDRPKSMPHTQQSGTSSRALDNSSLEDYEGHLRRQLDQIEKFRRRMQSYYSFDERLGMLPAAIGFPPANSPFDVSFRGRSASSGASTPTGNARWSHSRFGRSNAATKRARSVSPDRNKKAVKKNVLLTSAAARRRQSQPSCECFAQFLGVKSLSDDSAGTRVTITQQQSGGNNIVVFKEDLNPKAKFQFFSYRQKGFPFSLTFNDNNTTLQQSSACCESRYPVGSKLGGKSGLFKWLGVKNAVPCYKCQVHRGLQAPFTNYGQKANKIKRRAKKLSVDEASADKSVENVDDYPVPNQNSASTAGKPPRPRSARSRTSRQGSLAFGVAAGVAAVSGLASIEDREEGLQSKVPSEHGSSLNASSDEDNGDRKNSSNRSAIGRKSVQGDLGIGNDDFFDNTNAEMVNDGQGHVGNSSESSPSTDSGEESETESGIQTGNRRSENGTENGNSGLQNSGELGANDTAANISAAEKLADGEENIGVQADNKENDDASSLGSGTESRSSSRSSAAAANKSRKTSAATAHSRKGSSSQSEGKLRKESIASGWGQQSTTEDHRDETVKEEEENYANNGNGTAENLNNVEKTAEETNSNLEEPFVTKTDNTDEQAEKTTEESDSETSSSFSSDSEATENPSSKSNTDKNLKNNEQQNEGGENFANKLKSAGSALIAEGDSTDVTGTPANSETVTVDVHRPSNAGLGVEGNSESGANRAVDKATSLNPWICSECKFDNESDENECRICGAARFEMTSAIPSDSNAKNANDREGNDVQAENTEDIDASDNVCADPNVIERKQELEDERIESEQSLNPTLENRELAPESLVQIQQSSSWTCKFCAANNDGNAENCQACLLDKAFSQPKAVDDVDNQENANNTNSGSSFSSSTNAPEYEKTNALVVDKEARHESRDNDNNVSDNDADTLADARSLDADNRLLHAPDIEIQPPSPSVADLNSNTADSPRSHQNTENVKEDEPKNEENAGTGNENETSTEASLCEELKKSSVNLQDQTFTPEEVNDIAEGLSKNSNLNSITIKRSKITDADLRAISNALSENQPELRVINLNMNLLTAASVPSIYNLLHKNSVEILSLNDNKLGDEGVAHLMDVLLGLQKESGQKLLRLHIEENDLGNSAAAALGNYLKENDKLKSLSISGSTSISPEGWKHFARGLSENVSLQALHLDYCRLGDENVELICQALKNKPELKMIDVEGNSLTDNAASNLVQLVRTCPVLSNVVSMAGNTLSSETLTRIQQIIGGKQFPNEKDHLSLSAKDFAK